MTPKDWRSTTLGQVASLQRGFDLPVQDRLPGKFLVVASNGPVGTHDKAQVKGPGVVTGRSGTIGKVFYYEQDFWPLNTTLYVNDLHRNDAKFVAYFLESLKLDRFVASTGVPTLNRNVVHPLPVLVPPLGEQRKIAAILSSVDDAIQTTQAVIDQLGVVKKALMAELLTRGIPGRHTKFKQTEIGEVPAAWDVLRLEQLVISGPANGRSPPSRSAPPGVPTFSIAAVRHGRINIQDHLKYIDLEPVEALRFAVQRDDILIVRGNANPDLVGKSGIVVSPPAGCIYPDLLMRVRVSSKILPFLFVVLWNSDLVHDQVLDRAKTTNGTFKINGDDVRSILLPVPAPDEQRMLASAFASIDENLVSNENKLTALRNTKSALLSVLLTGELRVNTVEGPT